MKLRLAILSLIIILLTLALAGCWDYEEYEDMVQVSAIGIDYNRDSHENTLTIQYIPTTKSQSGQQGAAGSKSKEIVHSVTDKTLYEALLKTQQVVFKKLFFGYLKIIVINKEAARNNMEDIIEFLDRSPVIRSSSYIVLTSGKAEDTLSTFDASMVGSSSEEIYSLITLTNNTGSAYPVTVQDFTSMLAIPGLEATAPRVITVSELAQTEAKGGTEGNIRFDEERVGDQRISGIAAFKGAKFVGWLDTKASMGFGFIMGKDILNYKTSVTSGKKSTQEDVYFYRLNSSKGKLKVKFKHDKPIFQVNVKVVGNLMKYTSNKDSTFLDYTAVKDMEQKLAYSIRSDIQAAIKRGQKELKTDIFGLGFTLFREDPKLWRRNYEKNWQDIFPNVPIEIHVSAKIINTGSNNRKLHLK